MQTAANTTRFLMDFSSNRGFADSESAVSHSGLLQHILVSQLAQAANSHQVFNHLAQRLIRLAEHTLNLRDINALEEISLVLMNLPVSAARQIGQYYQALVINRNGQKGEALSLLEIVADKAPLAYRARAIQSLGGVHHELGQLDEALRLYPEATRAASLENDCGLLTKLLVHLEISCIRSEIGDHQGALAILESLSPLVCQVAKQNPLYFYFYHNELAVELAELGRIAEAEAACAVALASPFARAYPEWSETRDEIVAKRQSASHSVVAISRNIQPRRNVKSAKALAFRQPGRQRRLQDPTVIAVATIVAIARCRTTQCALELLGESIQARAPPALA